ncbi:MAG TPA: arginine decarboxylase, pyruvoyl-dependent [bacterium]|jgi:arginine decarboxylase
MVFARPDKYFLVAGYAEGQTPLNAFDNALMKAGIGNTNLMRISSILPPACTEIPAMKLPYGALIPTAYAEEGSDIPGTVVSAAVACGVPDDPELPGVIMEHHIQGDEETCRREVVAKVKEAFAMRGYTLAAVKVASASGTVKTIGAAMAAVVLWL